MKASSEYSEATQLFAACILASLEKERDTELGKLFGHTITVRPDGERVYDGLLYMDNKVYRLGLMTDGGNIHGIVSEHRAKEQQRTDFLESLGEAGLTLEQAEAARCTINLAVKESQGPRFCKVPERDLQAIIKTLESGLCQEGLLLVKRLLAK